MSEQQSVTGNPARDNLLMIAIQTLHNRGDNPSLMPSVQLELPSDFDLGADELAAMLDAMGIKPEAPVEAVVDAGAESVKPVEVPEHSRDHVLDSIVHLNQQIVQ